jgi:hypothetical protein
MTKVELVSVSKTRLPVVVASTTGGFHFIALPKYLSSACTQWLRDAIITVYRSPLPYAGDIASSLC